MPVRTAREIVSDLALDVDVAVVGTGAGGGMLLRDVARAGLQVVALEAGGYLTSKDFNGRERDMLPRLFWDGGGRETEDGGVSVLQGRGVGGSTVHNTCLCKRTPAPILDDWARRLGLDDWAPERVADDFAAVEALLHVSPIEPERVNPNNSVLLRGMQALGWRGGLLHHNRRGCAGSGFCELGCPFDAKENVLKALLPDALAAGATVLAEVEAERVLVSGGRAVGVEGRSSHGRRVIVRARAVVLAGSAVGSAALALRSDLPDPGRRVGRGLHLHPGAAVAGVFDERIEGWNGIPQTVECTQLLDPTPGSPDRVWIVPAFAHPVGLAAQLPGFGAGHMTQLRRYPHLAVLVAMLHDESQGRVEVSRGGRPKLHYQLEEADARALARGMAACARLLLAAGAREVLVPLGTPLVVRREADLAALEGHRARPLDPALIAAHPMSTLPMAADPGLGVVDGEGRWHGLPGLYVADGSVLPTSIGGPPQISIYTVGRRVARAVIADLR